MTGDAQFCQRALWAQILAQGGHYFFVVKENQPALREDLIVLFADPPWGEPMPAALRFGREHGREELRLLRSSAALTDYTDWPGLATACMLQRVVTRAGTTTYAERYAVTSLRPAQATAAQRLQVWRGHWGIENRLHWVRDVTLGEDRCQVRTGHGPQVLAAVRNTVIGILRRAGQANIAAALRTYAATPDATLSLIGIARCKGPVYSLTVLDFLLGQF